MTHLQKTSTLLWTKKDYREYKTKTATVCFYNFTNFLIEKNLLKRKEAKNVEKICSIAVAEKMKMYMLDLKA